MICNCGLSHCYFIEIHVIAADIPVIMVIRVAYFDCMFHYDYFFSPK